ncbi:SGNH/GDSL hydrolase family protein [Jeotgalibacillus sp. JSM ZJ347]|uniref:SGNH/GDSL hydrolase family protein n=1 Tax=Jeotgalibacillus sp. JSM ZJ347 TaxID=3342117 RepID=UPI0035A8CFFD
MQNFWEGKRFVSLGDSIVRQNGKVYGDTDQIAKGFQSWMKELLGFEDYDNFGVSGRPMANGSANGDGTNKTGKSVSFYQIYDLVIIADGTNDFKLNVPIGEPGQIGDTDFDTRIFYCAYRDLIEHILKDKPEIRIVLFTPLQRDHSGYDVNFTNAAGHRLINYANAITQIGELNGIPVCDMYRESGFTQLTLSAFTYDGVHPNDRGYEWMGFYGAGFIANIGS